MLVSFILPCYNVGRYIAECLDSIFAQSIPEDWYEVICINDCSNDNTRDIILSYVAKHPNLTLIDHSENLTAGGARNTGIVAAKGEYIWFVDPDDKIRLHSAYPLYLKAKEAEADILFFNNEVVDEKSAYLETERVFTTTKVFSGQEYINTFFNGHFSALCIVWRALFRTDFIRKNHLTYPQIRKAQDVVFLWKALLFAERVFSIEDVMYVYRSNPYSVAKKDFEAKVLFSSHISFASEVVQLLHDPQIDIINSIRKDMTRAIKWSVNSVSEVMDKMSVAELRNLYGLIDSEKEALDNVRSYMNRVSRCIFSPRGGFLIWLWKYRILAALLRLKESLS